MRSAKSKASVVVRFAALSCGAFASTGTLAQSQPMPGAPSVPFAPVAQAQNGGAGPQVTYQYGTEFVTIGGAGNAPLDDPNYSGRPTFGRGSVSYEYRIGRFEVTNSQWAAFYDAVSHVRATGQTVPFVQNPSYYSFSVVNGHYISTPGHEMDPVGGISWRTAAVYCNWLHNDQAVTRDAFLNGAYDVSTFGYNSVTFTDQLTHNPGARFWIPTYDEMIHANFYDPNRNGPGQGGYWTYNISQDTLPVYGPAGTLVNGQPTQANAEWVGPGNDPYPPFHTALGSYPLSQSPWGMLDGAGGTGEWTEGITASPGGYRERRFFGSSATDGAYARDSLNNNSSDLPSFPDFQMGFRLAASIPAPATSALIGVVGLFHLASRHRRR